DPAHAGCEARARERPEVAGRAHRLDGEPDIAFAQPVEAAPALAHDRDDATSGALDEAADGGEPRLVDLEHRDACAPQPAYDHLADRALEQALAHNEPGEVGAGIGRRDQEAHAFDHVLTRGGALLAGAQRSHELEIEAHAWARRARRAPMLVIIERDGCTVP